MASVALPPPKPPSDLVASALFLPLSSISVTAHKGRKLRVEGQVLAFDPQSSLCLLTLPCNTKPFPTILVNLSIPLLGLSPALREAIMSESMSLNGSPSKTHEPLKRGEHGLVNRERLRLDRGEWVTVVGWLEGDDSRLLRKVNASASYAAPLGLVLEAIFISPARPPPVNALYPTKCEAPRTVTESKRRRRRSTAVDEDITPRARRR